MWYIHEALAANNFFAALANHFMCLETWNYFTANITIFRKSSHYYIPNPNSFILSKSCWTIKRTRYLIQTIIKHHFYKILQAQWVIIMTSCFFWRKCNAKAGFLLTYLIIIIIAKEAFWSSILLAGTVVRRFNYALVMFIQKIFFCFIFRKALIGFDFAERICLNLTVRNNNGVYPQHVILTNN